MSLLSRAVKFISDRKRVQSPEVGVDDQSGLPAQEYKFNFSLHDYVKESFSVLIVRPFSKCVHKIIRAVSFTITGIVTGAVVAAIVCVIFMQFGSLENSVISSIVISRLEKIFNDSDLSIKSAMVNWNRDSSVLELDLKKVTIDDLVIPRITITPDYLESFKQSKLVAKTISLIKPKIALELLNDFKTVTFNPNLGKGSMNKAFFESTSSLKALKEAFQDSQLELVNADISVLESGQEWDFRNVYCDYNLKGNFPTSLNFSIVLPNQRYPSAVKIKRVPEKNRRVYKINLDAVNPFPIHNHFAGRNLAVEKVMAFIGGYNLPVSGNVTVSINNKTESPECTFDLYASSGCIKLPTRNTLSLNLGKRIDSGNISGSVSENKMQIDSISVNYGSSGMQLTGMTAPLSDFRFLDVVNMDGTLSFTNIDIKEMESILPTGISKSVIPAFKTYLPGFKLDLFRVDVNGPIAFGTKTSRSGLTIGQGVFKIHDARIPIGNRTVANVVATGNITARGIDVKLSNAVFGDTKINNGVFFISNEDNSWIGDLNANVSVNDIKAFGQEISPKLASLPLDKLELNGTANLDMKLVRVTGDKMKEKRLPFRIVKGEGVIQSPDNTKYLNVSWDTEKLSVVGDIASGKSTVHIKIHDNFATKTGIGEYHCAGNSEFLTAFLPKPLTYFSGDFGMNMTNSWNKDMDCFDITMNLKNATLSIPYLDDIKSQNENGIFKAYMVKDKEKTVLSNIYLNTKDAKIEGQVTFDKDDNISECVLNTFKVHDCAATINSLKKDDHNAVVSIVGDNMDLNRIVSAFNRASKDMRFSTYLNLKSLKLSSSEQMHSVKGTLEVLNSNIVGGACIGVIGENTTVALTSKKIDNGKDYLLSISASNAGDLLKYVGFTDTVSGGSANFVIKSSLIADNSFSGGFELKNFLVKNNDSLNKLISLSSSYASGRPDNATTGFNSCIGNVTVTKELIKINECRLIGPTMSISCRGTYDRMGDNLCANGMLLPAHSFMNNGGVRGALIADYKIFGPLGMISVSVDPLKFVENESLIKEFGNLIPVLTYGRDAPDEEEPENDEDNAEADEAGDAADSAAAEPSEKTSKPKKQGAKSDPFEQKLFDKVAAPKVKKIKVKKPRKSVDKKFGVTISRGLHLK